MSTTTPQQHPAPSWPVAPQPAPLDLEALARYESLSPAERARVARLVAQTGAPLGLAISAILATAKE